MNNPTIGLHHKITLLCIVRGNTAIKNYNSTHDTFKELPFRSHCYCVCAILGFFTKS